MLSGDEVHELGQEHRGMLNLQMPSSTLGKEGEAFQQELAAFLGVRPACW